MAALLATSTPPSGAIPLDSVDVSALSAVPDAPASIPLESINIDELQVDSGALPLESINPTDLMAEDDYLSKLTRRELSERAARDVMAGNPDTSKYRAAYKARAKERQIWDDNRLPEDQKEKPESNVAMGRAILDAANPALGALASVLPDKVFEVGQSMASGLFTQLQEAGRVVARSKERPLDEREQAWVKENPSLEWYVRLRPTTRQEQHEAASNLIQGAKLNGVQAIDMLRTGAIRVANKLRGDDVIDTAIDEQFDADVGTRMAEEGIRQGISSTGAQLPVDVTKVDEISQSPLSDPTMLFPGVAGFKAARAGSGVAARTLTTAETSVATAARQAMGRALAKPFDAAARTSAAIGVTLDNNPLLKGLAAAGAASLTGASVDTELLAGLLGANTRLKLFDKTSASLASTGAKLAGKVPPGPIGRFALSASAAVGGEFKGLVAGQLANTPFLLGAGDYDQLEDTLVGGVIAHSAGRAGGSIVNGLDISRNLWAERPSIPEVRQQIKDYGHDDVLDAAHRKVVEGLGNSSNNFVQAIRDYFGKDRGEVYTLFKDDYNAQLDALAASGKIQKDLAEQAKQQQGVTFNLLGEDGNKRNVAFIRVTPDLPGLSTGHESGHLLESVMSPEERKHIYNETRRFYGDEQIEAYRQRYEELANFSLGPNEPRVKLTDEQVLSEIFAEHTSAVLNSIPIEQFSQGGPGAKSYTRQVYSLVDRALEKIGAKQPKLTGGDGVVTGTGIEPSARLANLIENVIQAKKLDKVIPKAALPKGPVSTDVVKPIGASDEIAGARPVEKKEVPGLKKGDPVDEVRNSDGVLLAEGAKITKELGESEGVKYYEIEYTHPDTGERMLGNVPEAWLTSKVTPTAQKPKEVLQTHPQPITDQTPFGYPNQTAKDIVAPKQVENTTRPDATPPPAPTETPNVRVTRDQQKTYAKPATPEIQAENKKILDEALKNPRYEIPAVETDYYSAKSDVGHPDAKVRAEQRRLADKAEKKDGPNPLRKIYQKIFVPYRMTPWGGVFGFSLDKFIQNSDILRAWQTEKGLDAAYLSSDQFREDVKTYLENQSNGYAGDGRKLERPADTKPGSVTPENPDYTPRPLTTNVAQLINTLMGYELPEKLTPAQEYFRRFAEINGLTPKTLAGGVPEVNPVRDELRNSGFDLRLLNSAVENLPLKNLTTPLKARPDIDFKAGDTALTQAGFMPAGGPLTARRARGNDDTRAIAKDYIWKNRIQDEPHERYAPLNEERMKRIADLYEQAKHEPESPEVQKAYQALANETMAQYREMVAAGIKIEPWDGKGEPYKNSTEMMADVRDNKHLWFFKTDNGFGAGADTTGNALLSPSGVEINGQPLLVNDIFRAVHDYFGHTAEGFEFGPRGEYNAYLAHSRMFSDDAKPALAAETLAQNAWVNYGPHLRRADGTIPKVGDKDYVGLKDRRFADQKNTLIPIDVLNEVDGSGRKPAPNTPAKKRQAMKDSFRFMPAPPPDSPEFKRWFGGSTIVNEDGSPKVVYHTTVAADELTRFKRKQNDIGFHFGTAGQAEDRFNLKLENDPHGPALRGVSHGTLPVYLKLLNPIRLTDLGSWTGENLFYSLNDDPQFRGKLFSNSTAAEARNVLIAAGYDGVVYKNTGETQGGAELRKAVTKAWSDYVNSSSYAKVITDAGRESAEYRKYNEASAAYRLFRESSGEDSYIAFDSKQVKSAIGNNGEYNPKNADIRFMPQIGGQKNVQLEAKKRLPHSIDEDTLRLVHFGGTNVKEVDPKKFGKSGLTSPSEQAGAPRSYFYVKGRENKSDPVTQRADVYETTVSGAKLYDGDADPLGYADMINRWKADDMLQAQGYAGIVRSAGTPRRGYTQVELFEKVKVEPGDRSEFKFMPARGGQKEILGAVNGEDVRTVPIPKGSDRFHDDYGLRGDRFRYDPESKTIVWTDLRNEVSPESRMLAQDRLEGKGFEVSRQEDWSGRRYASAFMPKLYHGTRNDFTEFQKGRAGLVFLSDDPDYSSFYGNKIHEVTTTASKFADLDADSALRERVIAAFNSGNFRNTDDGFSPVFDPKVDETWELLESPPAVELLKKLGFDGAKFKETSSDGTVDGTTYALFDPAKVKIKKTRPAVRFMPEAGGQADAALRISTRVPTAKSSTEDPIKDQLAITAKDVVPDYASTKYIASILRKYPNTPAGIKDPKEVLKKFHDLVVDNLLFLHDEFDPKLRERAKLWYDGANKLAGDWSGKYGIPKEGVAGVLAALSPQKDWFMNVDLGRRVIEHRATLLDKPVTDGVIDWFRGKFGDKKPEVLKVLEGKAGEKFSSLGLLEQAIVLRAFDETTSDRGYLLITPEGDFGDPVKNDDGKPSKVAWGDFNTIAKALSIASNPTRENVSKQLGQEHKVRNFNNNILLPKLAEHGDVTIDTHAVAAGLLRPLSGSSLEVEHNFGSGAPSSAITGASGLYGLYADAYREAAKKRDRLPREMQSITWEAVRGLFTPEFKTARNQNLVDSIWNQYKAGSITLENARKQITELAGGIDRPSWAGPDR